MYWQFMWFVLAGFVLGFVVSTLWEWFHFRRERMVLRDRRVAELESQLQTLERRQAVADVYADDAVWRADEDIDVTVPYADMIVPEPATYPTSQPPRDIDLDIGFDDRAEFPDDVESDAVEEADTFEDSDTAEDLRLTRYARWVDAHESAVPAAAAAVGLAAVAARETEDDTVDHAAADYHAAKFDTANFDTAEFDTAKFDAVADADVTEAAIVGLVRTPGDAGAAADADVVEGDIAEGDEQITIQATAFDAAADADVTEGPPPAALGLAAYAAATMADAAAEADISEGPEVAFVNRAQLVDPTVAATAATADADADADADITEGPFDSAGPLDPHADADITEGHAPDLLGQDAPFDPHADADISEGLAPAVALAAATARVAKDFDAEADAAAQFDAEADADISEGPADDVRDRIAGFDPAADADVTEGPIDDVDVTAAAFDPHVDADISEGPLAQASALSTTQVAPSDPVAPWDPIAPSDPVAPSDPTVLFDAPYTVAPDVERDIHVEEVLDAPPLPPVAGRVLEIEERVEGDVVGGDTVSRDMVSRDMVSRDTVSRDTVVGDTVVGDTVADATVVDATVVDDDGDSDEAVERVDTAADSVADSVADTVTAEVAGMQEEDAPEVSVAAGADAGAHEVFAERKDEAAADAVTADAMAAHAVADAPLQDLSVEELVNLTVDRLAQAAAREGGQSLVLSPKARAELEALTAELRTHKPETRTTSIEIDAATETKTETGTETGTETETATVAAATADGGPRDEATSDGDETPHEEATDDVANTGYPDNLSMIKGIGPTYRTRLYEAGITTWRQVAEADVEELRRIARPPVNADVDEWPARAQALAEKHKRMDAEYVGPVPDDFTKIRGIGRHGMFLLYKAGICTFDQLSRAPLDKLAGAIPASPSGEKIDYAAWIEHAKRQIERKRGNA